MVSRVAHTAQPPAFTLRKTSIGPRSSTNGACDFCSSRSFFASCPSGSYRERRRGPLPIATKRTFDHSKRCHRFAVTLRFSSSPSRSFPSPPFCPCPSFNVIQLVSRDNRDTAVSIRERSLGKYLELIYTERECNRRSLLGCTFNVLIIWLV